MRGVIGCVLFLTALSLSEAQQGSHEPYASIEKAASNHSRGAKEPSLPINEPLDKSSRMGDSKYSLHPLPAGLWPKHSDPAVSRHHGPHSKARKGPQGGERPAVQHDRDKGRGETAAGPLHRAALQGGPSVVVATNHTLNLHLDALHDGYIPHHQPHQHHHQPHQHHHQPHQHHQQHQQHSEPGESYPNLRAKGPSQNPPAHRLDAEENRPAKASIHKWGGGGGSRNTSRLSLLFNRQPSSPHQLDILRRESDFTHDTSCLSECRKEREEREHYCHSEFALNGVVHDMEPVGRGLRLVTLMVGSDGFYKMSRLHVSPDSFFFKVRLLVLDSFRCSRPCPDLRLGSRYIVMGQIYHRRRHLPSDLLTILAGKLKPGDGLLRSNNYVKRFNKRKHQRALEASRSRCR